MSTFAKVPSVPTFLGFPVEFREPSPNGPPPIDIYLVSFEHFWAMRMASARKHYERRLARKARLIRENRCKR